MKKYIIRFTRQIAIILFVLISNISFSQPPGPPPPPGDGGGGGGEIPVGGSPIDGGLSIFILLGSAYGAYKYKKNK
ncbi:MAG: hypothetical protein WCH34_04655 [Bacteroidota bacterium]